MDPLAVIGIASTSILVCLCAWFGVRALAGRARKKTGTAGAGTAQPVPEGEDAYCLAHKGRVAEFYRRYRRLYDQVPIPARAVTVVKCTSVFSLEYVPVEHYAWVAGGAVYYFPKWGSIAPYLLDPAYIRPILQEDENIIFGWKIPAASLSQYTVDENTGTVTVEYETGGGRRSRTVFLEGGAEFFRANFPELDYKLRERRDYLASYKNIKDMEQRLDELKALLEQGTVTEDEYSSRRNHIMKLM
ncbi:MAG: hypothetical protein FWH02_09495 [Oscillospiraceae bacterium]|nr:hypothetical protein [Oscillospiraceae bacterium]